MSRSITKTMKLADIIDIINQHIPLDIKDYEDEVTELGLK